MERKRTSVFGIKGKLISAVAMLLVAVIMVVSSTYAWFTLSTAPEVRGIQTSIGANGALEIKLNDTKGITATIPYDVDGDGVIADDEVYTINNAEYGNLVDLSDEGYGLANIVLLPAMPNYNAAGQLNFSDGVMKYADYHDIGDGRPGNGTSANIVTSVYNGSSFFANDYTGVRAIGVASGMTERQQAYRSAKGAASTAMTMAKSKAALSLQTNGSALANLVILKAQGVTEFDKTHHTSLNAIVNDLLGTDSNKVDGILEYIEEAYLKQVLAYAASEKSNDLAGDNTTLGDSVYAYVRDEITAGNITLASIASSDGITAQDEDGTSYTFNLTGTKLLEGIEAFLETKASATAAKSKLDTIGANFTANEDYKMPWTEVSPVVNALADADYMTINGMTPSYAMTEEGQSALINSVASNGITVSMNGTIKNAGGEVTGTDGAGVYEQIADQCGDYTASVKLNITYGSLKFENIDAKMNTACNTSPAYLTAALAVVEAAGAPVAATTSNELPISEFYGYIIDLIFRTNAASSELLLQADATDRIYKDNQNSATQGGGSYMTYTSTDGSFGTEKVVNLMSHIRVIFFDTANGTVYGYAKLDVENYSVDADSAVTAKLYMYKYADGYMYKTTDNEDAYCTVVTTDIGVYTDEGLTVKADSVTKENLDADNSYTTSVGTGCTIYTKTDSPTYYVVDTPIYAFYKDADHNVEDTAAKAIWEDNANQKAFEDLFKLEEDHEFKAIKLEKNGEDTVEVADNTIVELPQNAEKGTMVSTLVYLDGSVENVDVPATATKSLVGKMNLQFASSANLVPMEYGDLQQKDTTQSGN